jgi:hypothetical protein
MDKQHPLKALSGKGQLRRERLERLEKIREQLALKRPPPKK